MPDYRNIKLKLDNLDIYYPLSKKVKLLRRISMRYFKGRLLDVGCGEMPYKNTVLENKTINEYVGIDIKSDIYQKNSQPDLYWDGQSLPIENNKFDCALLIEVLEHVPKPEIVLKEICRVLHKDGYLAITVPFLWNLHDVPNDEYRYTPFALKRILEDSGFEVVELEAIGSWHASLAIMMGIYCRRALKGRKRYFTSLIFKPIIKFLHKKDERMGKIDFTKNQMITGLWCVAKPMV
ncbi:class I SAM-dependent methyltransferase [Bizionia hallyeonensis]|uniref:Class I SAM-dependent methyltransferase n=1 Tax=Bizionia hallyeonensis TaxID=1123757 RepID=A0ABW0C5I4_9FLAO